RNYTPQDFQKVSETVAGKSLNDFFTKFVRGREELDYNQAFADFGLKLETATNAPEAALLGADFRPTGDLTVAQVRAGTPAYEQGLNSGDQIVAMNGFRVANQLDLNSRLAERKPNDKIKLTIFRYDELRELEIVLGGTKPQIYRFTSLADANENQRKLYQGWLGATSE
ncbi:MAG: PDZ domain-containing protein, partial [Pyrinomonadaceae bacterium]|nr:PDZ domain-containing protein [Pyrinomonadaceae bacterium]